MYLVLVLGYFYAPLRPTLEAKGLSASLTYSLLLIIYKDDKQNNDQKTKENRIIATKKLKYRYTDTKTLKHRNVFRGDYIKTFSKTHF